ncbi:MAG: hypothetical protein C0412_19975 [Flavobacterium sp.]|nr:hypothetical protein [Flavobacterium sp.]
MEESKKVIKPKRDIDILLKKTQIWANIVICLQFAGILIAFFGLYEAHKYNTDQIERAEKYERRKNAIEAVNKVFNSEFINNLSKLDEKSSLNKNETVNALNLVFNTYSIIAIVYNNEIADNKIIQEAVQKEVVKFIALPIFRDSFSDEAKKEIIDMVNKFKK